MSKERIKELEDQLTIAVGNIRFADGGDFDNWERIYNDIKDELDALRSPTMETLKPLCDPATAHRMSNGRINAMLYDSVSMGTNFSKNVMILHDNHASEVAKFMTLFNTQTGERVCINFPEHWQ